MHKRETFKLKMLGFDGDIIKHRMANVGEKRSIIVTHKKGGVKEFKTRTEFYGPSPKYNKGWLATANEKLEESGKPLMVIEDFEIKDVQTPEPIEHILRSVRQNIKATCSLLGCADYQIILGKGDVFRHDIPTPAECHNGVTGKYKGTRDGNLRPVHLQAVHDYLIKYHGAIVITDIEADDYLAQLAYEDHESGKDEYCVITADKDQMGCDGITFNPDYMEYPVKITGFGSLWLGPDGKKVRGTGRMWKYFQMIAGDNADNYKPNRLPVKKISFGDKGAYNLLVDCVDDKACLEVIVSKFKEWVPEPMTYTSHLGTEETVDWKRWLTFHADFVHMRRYHNDRWMIFKIMNHFGVEY